MAISYTNTKELAGLHITSSTPIDDRIVVDDVSGLTSIYNATTNPTGLHHPYQGMIVVTKDSGDIYVLTSSAKGAKNLSNWKKIGGSDSSASNIAAVLVNSEDELTDGTTIASPYVGMLAVIKNDDSESSEDERGLYVLLETPATSPSNWLKIGGGSSVSSNVDITTDGTAPVSGNGFSIDPEDSDAYVEDTYVSGTTLFANTYYTGNGFGLFNGGYGNLAGVTTCVELKKNNSIIKFWANNDANTKIYLDKEDDFGISYSDIVDEDGNPCNDSIEVSNGHSIKFLKDLDLSGATEVRDENVESTYIFGSTGSTIADLDIYISKVLPTVYVYAGDTSVKVLTEGDKVEIINMIGETVEPEVITEDEIDNLFGDSSELE